MGKTQEEPILSERVGAARRRAESLIQGRRCRPIRFDTLLAQGSPADDPGDEFLAELRRWRTEGEQQK